MWRIIGKENCRLSTFTGVIGMWLKPVGLFTGECSFGFALVRGALAGRVTRPTFETNVLEFTACAGFSCMKGPASPFGKLWTKTIWLFFAVGAGRMGFVARGEHRLEPKFPMNVIPQEQIWVRLP